jgi:hypothetical protein
MTERERRPWEIGSWVGLGAIVVLIVMGGLNGLVTSKAVEHFGDSTALWTAIGSIAIIVSGAVAFVSYRSAQHEQRASRSIDLLKSYHDQNYDKDLYILRVSADVAQASAMNAAVLEAGFKEMAGKSVRLTGKASEVADAADRLNDYYSHVGLLIASKLADPDVFLGNLAYLALVTFACAAGIIAVGRATGNASFDGLIGVARMAYPFYVQGPDVDHKLVEFVHRSLFL